MQLPWQHGNNQLTDDKVSAEKRKVNDLGELEFTRYGCKRGGTAAKFGDGIMSAIDFSMDVEKEEDPKGDQMIVTMNGKFLPYKSW